MSFTLFFFITLANIGLVTNTWQTVLQELWIWQWQGTKFSKSFRVSKCLNLEVPSGFSSEIAITMGNMYWNTSFLYRVSQFQFGTCYRRPSHTGTWWVALRAKVERQIPTKWKAIIWWEKRKTKHKKQRRIQLTILLGSKILAKSAKPSSVLRVNRE